MKFSEWLGRTIGSAIFVCTVNFVILKCLHLLDWSWFVVLSPYLTILAAKYVFHLGEKHKQV